MIYVNVAEYCDWEGETWNFYFQWDKNPELLQFINGLGAAGIFEAREMMILNDTRDTMIKSENTTYLNEHNFIDGIVDIEKLKKACKDEQSTIDALYKGGIKQFMVDKIPSYSKDFKL